MGVIYNGVTVKGRTYNNGDTFTAATSSTWYGSSDGTNGSGTIPSGATVTFIGYMNDYSWQIVHYIVKSPSFNGNYQCWTSDAIFPTGSWTVSYNANGGTGAPGSQTKYYGSGLTLSSTKPTRGSSSTNITTSFNANGGSTASTSLTSKKTTSYTFSHWNTNSDNTGTTYAPGATYWGDANMTLYAQWSSSESYTSITLPSATRSGYKFLGWYTAPSWGKKVGDAGDSYKPTSTETLYAQWKKNEVRKINAKSGSTFVNGVVRIKKDGKWVIVTNIKAKTSSGWQ